jgi:hypothetical protein
MSKPLPTGGQANVKGMSKFKIKAFCHLSFGFDLTFELWYLAFSD